MRVYGTCYQVVVDTTPTRLCVSTDVPNYTDTPYIVLMSQGNETIYSIIKVQPTPTFIVSVTHYA